MTLHDQKSSSQFLAFLNVYLHAENKKYSSIPSGDIVDQNNSEAWLAKSISAKTWEQ